MTTDRTITIFNSDRLRGSFVAHSFGARVEAGYRVDLQGLRVTPYGALQIEAFRAPSYGETVVAGAGDYALRYDGRTASTARAELGTWLDTRLRLDIGGELILRTRFALVHDWAGDQIVGASFPAFPGANFTVIGAPVAPNSALTSFGAEWRLASGLSVLGKFDAEFAPHSTVYVGTGTVRYTW
jgi:outer membrane autotransporter protein